MADENEENENEADTDTGGQSGNASEEQQSGTASGQDARVMFSPAQQEYLNKLLADERRAERRKVQESDEYKQLKSRARRADELEGQGRQEVETLEEQLAKAKAERAAALASAENALIKVQFNAVLAQRGVPVEMHQDSFLLADKSGIKVNLSDQSVTGVEEAVQEFIESRPWFVGVGVAPRSTQAARPAPNLNGGSRGTPASEEARIAAAMGEMQQRGMGRI